MVEPAVKPSRTYLRILCGLAVVCGIAWLLYSETQRLHQRGQRELAEAPDEAIPEYDCFEEGEIRPPDTGERPALIDVTDEWQIDFQHQVGPLGTWYMPESIGAGAAILDYDQDGLMDLYFVNCGRSPMAVADFPPGTRIENRLFRQTQPGRFLDVTAESGLGDTGYGAGVAVGDVDNDGFPDVFVANYGQDALFRNTGRGTFENITANLGSREAEWGAAAAFVDYDRDGWLDLMVVNYTVDPVYGHSVACGFQHGVVSYCGPHKFQPAIDHLYHNETGQSDPAARRVQFRDVTEEAGLTSAPTFGFGTICTDLTSDGWPDLFVANDGAPNRLWVNRRDGTFAEEGALRGVALNGAGAMEAGMGVALGDVNADLFPDIVVTHLSMETNTLYLADTSGGFIDRTSGSGLDRASRKHTGWGAALVDLDHDGLLDLPQVNGLVIPCRSGFPFHGEDAFQQRTERIRDNVEYWKAYADQNKLLMGESDSRFRDAPALGGDFTAAVASGRGLACGDLDNDGDLDLVVTRCGSDVRCYRNDFPKSGHWLMVRVETGPSGRDALGAKVTLELAEGRSIAGYCVPQTSYLASHDPRIHFGLGAASRIEAITVEWPDGPVEAAVERFPGGDVDQVRVLTRGSGESAGRSADVPALDQ